MYERLIKTGRNITLIASLAIMSACATRPVASSQPQATFTLTQDLVGKKVGRGSFSAIDGTYREFVVYMDGSWDGKVLTLVEDFEYLDGVKERKTWHFTALPNGEFSGIREDVVGTARGFQDGKTFRLEYTMTIPKDDGTPGRKVSFKDVLVKQDDGTIRNEANVGFWGLKVGKVGLTISEE